MPRSDPDGPVRDCGHPRAAHQHGTRAAYSADRCRCAPCRAANRAHARARRRALAYGRWQPYVDAGPVRAHLQRLRDAGVGIERIIALSGVGSGTVRELLYDTRVPDRRLRTATAQRLLDIPLSQAGRAAGGLCDASVTRHQLQELREAGHTWADLATMLGRDPGSLRAILRRRHVRVRTAAAVAEVHRRLIARPAAALQDDPGPADLGDGSGGELEDIDEVAVEQAMQGRPVRLTAGEERVAIERLTRQGRSVRQIAALLHTSARTVSRRRAMSTVA